MKRKLFTILTIVLGGMFMVSCGGSDNPDPAPVDKTINEKILAVMNNNYLWSLPANPNLEQDAKSFFGSLLSQNDFYKDGGVTFTFSRISETNAPVSTVYDPGFEYAINNYLGNVTYYVVLYVKPNTPASEYLARGLYITKVNGTAVTAANASTLLPNAYNKGAKMTLSIITPMLTDAKDNIPITPVANYVEAPLHKSSVLTAGTQKVGYIAYNNFSSGANYAYDNALASKLNEFKNQGITNLVFDVRYNSGGGLPAIQALGSALVKGRDTNKAFIQQVHRADLPTPVRPLNFLDKTAEGKGTDIPKLGDQLDKIYIITGQSTAGASEAMINAIKAYRPNDVVLVGEKTKGRTIATARTTEDGTSGKWNLTLAYLYMADVNKNYNYGSGFTPTTVIKEVEVAAKNKILLGELGTKDEVILSQVLKMIDGTRSTSVLETRSSGFDRELKTSLGNRLGANETMVDLY